jgi:hypothetical protein
LLCSNNQRAVQCAIYFSNTPRPHLVPKIFKMFRRIEYLDIYMEY